MQRTFIALKVNPDPDMMEIIQQARHVLEGERITWVDPGKLHITVKFLGDTDPQQIKVCSKILRETVPKYSCPQVIFRGLGLFRNIHDPRVLWIGMNIGESFFSLKSELDLKLERYGFKRDRKKSQPHLTLGRIKSIRQTERLQSLMEDIRGIEIQQDVFEEVVYYESILRPEGPGYLPILKVPFNKI